MLLWQGQHFKVAAHPVLQDPIRQALVCKQLVRADFALRDPIQQALACRPAAPALSVGQARTLQRWAHPQWKPASSVRRVSTSLGTVCSTTTSAIHAGPAHTAQPWEESLRAAQPAPRVHSRRDWRWQMSASAPYVLLGHTALVSESP
jgi:hypothetical protein